MTLFFPLKYMNPFTKSNTTEYELYFDGCCKGNPGVGGAGAVIYHHGNEIWGKSLYVGEKTTNNIAEYTGLIFGLDAAVEMGIKTLVVKGDSQLVIKQMRGEYQVKSENLVPLFTEAKKLAAKIDEISFVHVYRNENKRADELSNHGLDIV
jgi:ribonuclease HI